MTVSFRLEFYWMFGHFFTWLSFFWWVVSHPPHPMIFLKNLPLNTMAPMGRTSSHKWALYITFITQNMSLISYLKIFWCLFKLYTCLQVELLKWSLYNIYNTKHSKLKLTVNFAPVVYKKTFLLKCTIIQSLINFSLSVFFVKV